MQRIELVVPTGYEANEIKITLKPGKIPVKVVEKVPESDAGNFMRAQNHFMGKNCKCECSNNYNNNY